MVTYYFQIFSLKLLIFEQEEIQKKTGYIVMRAEGVFDVDANTSIDQLSEDLNVKMPEVYFLMSSKSWIFVLKSIYRFTIPIFSRLFYYLQLKKFILVNISICGIVCLFLLALNISSYLSILNG